MNNLLYPFKIELKSYAELSDKEIFCDFTPSNELAEKLKKRGFKFGKHLLKFLRSKFKSIDKFKLILTKGGTRIEGSDVYVNIDEYTSHGWKTWYGEYSRIGEVAANSYFQKTLNLEPIFSTEIVKKYGSNFIKTFEKLDEKEKEMVLNNPKSKKIFEYINKLPLKQQKYLLKKIDLILGLAPRYYLLKDSLKEFRKKVREHKKQKGKNEKDIHAFLKKHYWLLGIEYWDLNIKSSISEEGERTDKEVIQEDSTKPDFIIDGIDGIKTNVRFIELEDIKDKVKHKKGQKETGLISSETMDGISQVLRYNINAKLQGLHPKGVVIVGTYEKDAQKWKEKLLTVKEFLGNIEILTYDDIIERAKNVIEFFEKYGNKKK